MFKSNLGPFKSRFSETIFVQKYRHEGALTWDELSETLVEDVCQDKMSKSEKGQLKEYVRRQAFVPGGRYIYYAGRSRKFFNNCYLLRSEQDTREDWADLSKRAELCLSTGGGIGNDYSVYRASGTPLHGTGGIASGPLSAMHIVNEIGRNIMQGGSRRSAIYASLNWKHGDISKFLVSKNWYAANVAGTDKSLGQLKEADFNFPCPLDMSNISVNYDTSWLLNYWTTGEVGDVFLKNVQQAMSTGEPGFSFNFFDKENETLRNACVTGNTLILTSTGYQAIESLVGKEVIIWNGDEFSKVTPRSTGIQDLVRVHLSDGSYLTCTPNHMFILAGGLRVRADALNLGERLEKFQMPFIESGEEYPIDAYSQGFYSGDGNTDYEWSWLYTTKYCVKSRLIGTFSKENTSNKIRWSHGPMYGKTWVPIHGTSEYCLNWLAGLCDSDGTVTRDKNGNGIQITSVNQDFIEDVQLMLTRLGVRAKINHAATAGVRPLPDGHGGYKDYYCQDSWRLMIGNLDTYNLLKAGFTTSRLALHNEMPQRDARRFVVVLEVEDLNKQEETYCFDEPRAHRGAFNGIVTGNCTEVTSEDDSDVCNLGSINLARISSISELVSVVDLATKFLLCGTLVADLPYEKVKQVREKNRRLGLGLMGIHEWLIQRGYRYEVSAEFHRWLAAYKSVSTDTAIKFADALGVSRPVAVRAIAPTGSIAILCDTTTSIEPIFAVAYKRRYYKGTRWHYQYVVDAAAQALIQNYGAKPDNLESAVDLATDYERRIKFQADVQDYVDMGISSTINLPEWGSKHNSPDIVLGMANCLASYAHRLRGFTAYPDGSRGGQPITSVPYAEAVSKLGEEFEESIQTNDICEISNRGGSCGT